MPLLPNSFKCVWILAQWACYALDTHDEYIAAQEKVLELNLSIL